MSLFSIYPSIETLPPFKNKADAYARAGPFESGPLVCSWGLCFFCDTGGCGRHMFLQACAKENTLESH